MELNSLSFVLFLAGVCALSYLCPARFRYIWLLVCSYAFYLYNPLGWRENLPALGLLLCTTAVSYLCSVGMARARQLVYKRAFLLISLAVCLGLLIACKYFNFFMGGLRDAGVGIPVLDLVLPLGISYYTLQSVSYAADVYLGNCQAEMNPVRYALYLSFFPGIVTGPINRAPEMLPQYKNPPRFNYNRVAGGLFRVLWGLCKKMVIADTLGRFTAQVFSSPGRQSGPVLILAALLFTYQLYADFGGCCDIAIGSAQMLGFRFMENFERPFSAKTFSGLWQRWHISLTSFFRDYVFTPLVWSRWTEKLPAIGRFFQKPPVASSVLIIYTLSGLWHGAHVGFVLWGLVTGLFMVGAKWVAKPKDRLAKRVPLYRNKHVRGFVQRIIVYCMFTLTLIFFACSLYDASVLTWFGGLAAGWNKLASLPTLLSRVYLPPLTLLMLGIAIVVVELCEAFGVKSGHTMADWIRERRWWQRWPLYYLLVAALLAFGQFGSSDFIYGNF